MSRRSARVLGLAMLGVVGLIGGCKGRALFDRPKPSVERVNPNIPGGNFRILASVAGGDALTDFQIVATVRDQLADSGVTMLRKAGRWDSQPDAVRAICAPGEVPSVDAVLFIWYNRLELRDCGTGSTAYEVLGHGKEGIQQLTDRLIRYLKHGGEGAAASAGPSST